MILEGEAGIGKSHMLGDIISKRMQNNYESIPFNTLFINEAKDELLLTGNIPQNIESVSINGYKLQEFIPGGNSFTYKVSKSSGTLLE